MRCSKTILVTISIVASQAAVASSRVSGETVGFQSPNGIQEQCIILEAMPGGTYSEAVRNTYQATGILRSSCQQGKLRFDLNPEQFLRTGTVSEDRLNCANP